MLDQAGVGYAVEAATVDEEAVKAGHAEGDSKLALALAEAKALDVGARRLGDWVIGGGSRRSPLSTASKGLSAPWDPGPGSAKALPSFFPDYIFRDDLKLVLVAW